MNTKTKLGLISMFSSLALMGFDSPHGMRENRQPKETDEERKSRLAKAQIERYKAQGLTEFFYGDNSLWALNEKSADRKARKRNWI